MTSNEQDDLLFIITTILSILLIISEMLGLSKCDANSIIQLLGKLHFKGCNEPPSKKKEEEVVVE